MAYQLPPLPYDYKDLEPYIDEETMRLHHDKHHAGYVEKLNAAVSGKSEFENLEIAELLVKLDDVPEEIRTAVRNNGGGHTNHTLFWEIMHPSSGVPPTEKLGDAINKTFGSFDTFVEKFSTSALNHFGSGWAWLVVTNGKLSVVDTLNQDSPLMDGITPILGLDVWEHAYYLKYQNKRKDYIDAWWNVVNWPKVEEYFNRAFA